MHRFPLLFVLLSMACGETRPDACTSQELGWTPDDTCFFNEPAVFFSDERQDCGPPTQGFRGLSQCHELLTFDDGEVTWNDVDVFISRTYTCDGTNITIDGDETATWVPATETLVWNGLDYLPMCTEE